MKKHLWIAALAVFVLAGCKHEKEPGYTITGNITGADTGWVLLKTRDGQVFRTMDSVAVDEGKFEFKGTLGLPEMYFMTIKGSPEQFSFFLENSALTVTLHADSLQKSTVTGSKTHDLYRGYKEEEKNFNLLLEEHYRLYEAAKESGDTVAQKVAERKFDSIQELLTAYQKEFVSKNVKSVVSPYLAMRMAYLFNFGELTNLDKALDTTLSRSIYVKDLKKRLDILSAVQPGKEAPDFTMNDTLGNPVSLKSFRGKVLLVDFWASWCGPCRHENPNIVAAYQAFSEKGFDVLGVSLDDEKSEWIKAIHKDKLTWTHVSDLQGWQNSASKLYGVMSIPANFLLDREGKIIASELTGDVLKAKLSELFASEAK